MKLWEDHHPLYNNLHSRTEWQIRQALIVRPPTRAQLDELAAEELTGKDRHNVMVILEKTEVRK